VKRFVPIIIILLFSWLPTANAADTEEIFHEANKAYSDGNYTAAEEGYRKLLSEGIESSSLHNNLGEALYRQGKIGEAIFQFMWAERLAPRNAEVKYNLNYAKARITDKLERPSPHFLIRPFSFVEQKLSRSDSWMSFAIVSIIFWGSVIIFLFYRRDWLRWIVLVLGIIFLINSGLLLKKEIFTKPFGVVTAEEAPVYSAPGEDNVLLFKLHEGSDFQVLEGRETDWIQIKLPDGKKGWIKKEDTVI